jgi:hypothetical protein
VLNLLALLVSKYEYWHAPAEQSCRSTSDAQFTGFTGTKVQILTRACKAALPLDLYARLLFTASGFFFFSYLLSRFFFFFFPSLDLYARLLFTVSVTRAGAHHFTCFTGTKVQIPTLLFRHSRRGSVAAATQALSY